MDSFVDPQERVSLQVAGNAHDLWDYYAIESSLMTAADAWAFSLSPKSGPFPPDLRATAPAQVRIGSDLVMTGRIDNVTRLTARPQRRLSISGRDGAAVLVDCSAPIFSAKQITLAEVIANVVRPLGIAKIRLQSDDADSRSEKVAIDPGIRAWDALQQAAEAVGLWPWFEPDGTLVIGGPDYTTEPVASLIERIDGQGNNVLSLEHVDDMTQRHSEITLLAQSHGTGMHDGHPSLVAKAQDRDMRIYRPLVHVEGDLPNAVMARAKARKMLMDGRLSGLGLTATVRGHRTSAGILWTPGQRIHVSSESLGIDGVWFLMERVFTGGRGRQRTTSLLLVEDGVWVIDAFKKKKGRKGKKLQAVVVDVS